MINEKYIKSCALAAGILSVFPLSAGVSDDIDSRYAYAINSELASLRDAQRSTSKESSKWQNEHFNNVVQYYKEVIEAHKKALEQTDKDLSTIKLQSKPVIPEMPKKPSIFSSKAKKAEYEAQYAAYQDAVVATKKYEENLKRATALSQEKEAHSKRIDELSKKLRSLQIDGPNGKNTYEWNQFMFTKKP
jgi:hypothetical protein